MRETCHKCNYETRWCQCRPYDIVKAWERCWEQTMVEMREMFIEGCNEVFAREIWERSG